mgnify:CR=1 FL=1
MLNQDFKEFIALLNQHNVQYIVIGGYALAFHGHPRYTKDIDIWIDAKEDNAKRVLDVLRDFGFGSVHLDIQDFISEENIIQLGYPPNRIDILTSAKGVVFGDCISSSHLTMIDDLEVRFLDIQNLIVNKQETGRLQDLADVEALEKLLKKKKDV